MDLIAEIFQPQNLRTAWALGTLYLLARVVTLTQELRAVKTELTDARAALRNRARRAPVYRARLLGPRAHRVLEGLAEK
jgi:hypothetical protein